MKQTWLGYSRILQLPIQDPLFLPANKILLTVPPLQQNWSTEEILTTSSMCIAQKQNFIEGTSNANTKIIMQ